MNEYEQTNETRRTKSIEIDFCDPFNVLCIDMGVCVCMHQIFNLLLSNFDRLVGCNLKMREGKAKRIKCIF